MARLGSVVGGVLAELARARAVADRLTRELVDDYEDDPILSGMSVPRVKLSEASLTVRYVVNDIAEEEPPEPDPAVVADRWRTLAGKKLLATTLDKLGIAAADRERVADLLAVGGISPTAARQALKGNTTPLIETTVESVLASWDKIPASLRRKLGGKPAVRNALRAEATAELEDFLSREARQRLLTSVLASQLDVGVLTAELPDDPGRIQEVQLTVTGEDLELVLKEQEG